MALSAFFRLVWRPAFAIFLPLSGFFLVVLFVLTLDKDLDRARQLDLSMLAVPLVLGMFVGQTVHDVRCRLFSWTIPNLQWRLGASVIGLALLSALLWTWAYRSLGGGMNALAAFAEFSLVFMACAAVQRSIAVVLAILMAAGIWSDLVFGFIRAHPIGWTVFALLGAAVCFHAGFSRRSARRILLAPYLFLAVNLFNRAELARAKEGMLTRSSRPRQWRLSFVGTEIRDWVRAVEYGSFGATSRVRATSSTYVLFGVLGFMITYPAFTDRSFEMGLEHAFHVLFSPPVHLEDATFVPVYFFQAIWALGLVFGASGRLQRGWVYPLSRHLRSLIVYRMSLRQNLRLVQMLSLTFVFYGALIVVLRGGIDDLGFIPGFFRGVIAVVILVPIAQGIRLRLDRISPQGGIRQRPFMFVLLGIVPVAGLVQLLTYQWPRLFAEVAFPIQALLLIALALHSQGIFYRVVTNHYQREDLI